MKNTAQTILMNGLRAVWNRENLPEGVHIVETDQGARIHFRYTIATPLARREAQLAKLRQLPNGITRIQKGEQS